MANAWERYKASRAYQDDEAERRALSLTLAVRDQALQQTGEEVDAQLASQQKGGGFSGNGAGRAPAQRTVKSAPPAVLPESKGKRLALPTVEQRTNPLTTPAKSGFFEGLSILPSSPDELISPYAWGDVYKRQT